MKKALAVGIIALPLVVIFGGMTVASGVKAAAFAFAVASVATAAVLWLIVGLAWAVNVLFE